MRTQTLVSQAIVLESSLKIKNRRHHLKQYKNCFVGKEAVQVIINLKFVKNEYEAIKFGNELIQKDLMMHVEKKHTFKKEKLFYRFTQTYYQLKAHMHSSSSSSNDVVVKSNSLLNASSVIVKTNNTHSKSKTYTATATATATSTTTTASATPASASAASLHAYADKTAQYKQQKKNLLLKSLDNLERMADANDKLQQQQKQLVEKHKREKEERKREVERTAQLEAEKRKAAAIAAEKKKVADADAAKKKKELEEKEKEKAAAAIIADKNKKEKEEFEKKQADLRQKELNKQAERINKMLQQEDDKKKKELQKKIELEKKQKANLDDDDSGDSDDDAFNSMVYNSTVVNDVDDVKDLTNDNMALQPNPNVNNNNSKLQNVINNVNNNNGANGPIPSNSSGIVKKKTKYDKNALYSSDNPEDLFDIIQPLGKGAFGMVYKALDKRDGELVALKIMAMEGSDEVGSLEQEVAIMKKCKCPYIVNFCGAWLKDDNIWIAMEYCGGGGVLDIMRALKISLTEPQIAVVICETLKALQYVHSQKLIHRDIKAANILLNHKGQCKLADILDYLMPPG